MNSYISVAGGTIPVVATFFSELSDIEKQVDRITAIYSIAVQVFIKGVDGFIPDPIVGDEACQARALIFAINMPSFSYQQQLKDSLEALEVEFALVKKVQDELKKHRKEIDCKMKPLKAESRGLIKKIKLQTKEDNSSAVETAKPEGVEEVLTPDKQKLEAVEKKIAAIEKEDKKVLKSWKKKISGDILLSAGTMTYLHSSILTMVKKKRTETNSIDGKKIGHDDTVPAQIKPMAGALVNDDIKQIIKVAQRELTKLSVDFIQMEAAKCACSDSFLLQKMVSKVKLVKHPLHGDHHEIPCFHATRVIFQRALESHIPIILKVRNVKGDPYVLKDFSNISLHTVDATGSFYAPSKWDSIASKTPAIVMECRTERPKDEVAKGSFIPEVLEKTGGIIPLIEHLVAQHVQYTDQRKSAGSFTSFFDDIEMPDIEREKIIAMGIRAIEMGITPIASTLCCPEHIYCGRISDEMLHEAANGS